MKTVTSWSINKPRDLVVHPGAGNPDGTVLNALLHHYPEIADVPRWASTVWIKTPPV